MRCDLLTRQHWQRSRCDCRSNPLVLHTQPTVINGRVSTNAFSSVRDLRPGEQQSGRIDFDTTHAGV